MHNAPSLRINKDNKPHCNSRYLEVLKALDMVIWLRHNADDLSVRTVCLKVFSESGKCAATISPYPGP